MLRSTIRRIQAKKVTLTDGNANPSLDFQWFPPVVFCIASWQVTRSSLDFVKRNYLYGSYPSFASTRCLAKIWLLGGDGKIFRYITQRPYKENLTGHLKGRLRKVTIMTKHFRRKLFIHCSFIVENQTHQRGLRVLRCSLTKRDGNSFHDVWKLSFWDR